MVVGDTSRQDVAQKLSQWVGVFESVTLHAAHQSVGTVADTDAKCVSPDQVAALQAQCRQVQQTLVRAIEKPEAADTGARRGRHPLNQPEPPPDAQVDFAPYRQHYLDQQRNMKLMVGPLRNQLRQTLAQASPALRQLATLDAVWEQLLDGHTQKLTATVPVRLQRRFEHLRKLHTQPPAQDASLWRQPGGWLHGFNKELQAVLRAELDVRLEPVWGLIDAFSNAEQQSEQEG